MNLENQTTEALLATVGATRASQAPEAIEAAEAELARRGSSEADLFRSKVMRAGKVCAFIGGLFVVWGLLMGGLGLTVLAPAEEPDPSDPVMFRHFDLLYVGGSLAQASVGVLLLAGGLGVRRFRRRGRRLVLAVVWAGFASIGLFTVFWVYGLLGGPGGFSSSIVFAVAGLANAGFWSFVLWLPYRFFASERVRELCSE